MDDGTRMARELVITRGAEKKFSVEGIARSSVYIVYFVYSGVNDIASADASTTHEESTDRYPRVLGFGKGRGLLGIRFSIY